jgi:hypothetical protein
MTSRLQNPSTSWKTGVDQRNNVSQLPIVTVSTKPPWPKIHALIEVSAARFPSNVLSTHPLLLFESTEKRLRDQISKVGTISDCVERMRMTRNRRNRDWSGVASLSSEKKK